MMSKWNLGSLGIAALLVAAGCTSEQPPRSFVQPNIIKKTDLVGPGAPAPLSVWHYRQTVVSVPPTNGAVFNGLGSDLEKITFKITQDFVYALRAYEHVQGSEDSWWRDPARYEGQPLAAWRIQSHFDIIRDYNATTGEQTNRVIESTERPWQDREFMRVDWSRNEVTDYIGIGLSLFFSDGQPTIQPSSYWEADPTKPDAMHFDRFDPEHNVLGNDDGFAKGEATYFDITNQLVLTPEMKTLTYEEGGKTQSFTYPACFFYYFQDDCASQKVKVRHAFAKVGPKHEYVPRQWDGKQMQLFGVWDIGLRRMTYNRQYGITNSGFRRHAARFNLWKKSYAIDADGKQEVLPYDKREVKPIPYYASGTQPTPVDYGNGQVVLEGRYPEDLYGIFKEVIRQWDDAQRDMLHELMPTRYASKDMAPHVFIPCHNPVKLVDDDAGMKDPEECKADVLPETNLDGSLRLDKNGQPIYRVRQGDPRRSVVFWVNEQQNGGPLGYGPGLYDPETGETISGQAYMYGAAIDTYSARARDMVLLQNGEFTTNDFVTGANVNEIVSKLRYGDKVKPQTFEPSQVLAMARAMDFSWAAGLAPELGLDMSSPKALKNSINAREDRIYKEFFQQRALTSSRQNNLARLAGTPLEKMMISTENIALGGVSPTRHWDQLAPAERAMVSPIRQQVIENEAIRERQRAERLGVDFATFDETNTAMRLRQYLNDPNWCPTGPESCVLSNKSEELRVELRKQIYLGVTLHEMGHNVGCRHNFRGSYDAMNFFPEYWKIRKEAINHPDPGMGRNPDNKIHSRYLNFPGAALTQYELDQGVREYQYSSIMDYGAEFNADLKGLGLYDKALIKFSYGELLEVLTDTKPDAMETIGSLHAFQNSYGLPSPLVNAAGLKALPYTIYPDLFNSDVDGIYMRATVPREQVQERVLNQQTGSTVFADDQNRPLVPYYFCSDEFAGNLTCQRFDAGPDPYEQATDIISRYQNFYLVNNFKRDRQNFRTSAGYLSRIKGRFFDVLRQQLTWYVLLRADFERYMIESCQRQGGQQCDAEAGEAWKFLADEKAGWAGFTLGVSLGFEALAKTITTPTMGLFQRSQDATGQLVWKQFNDNLFEDQNINPYRRVSYIDGKYNDTRWDYDGCGYYWSHECQTRIGYMIDKELALDVLSDSQAYFTGRDTNTDVRQYAIGYIIPFKKQIEDRFGAIFADDLPAYAPSFVRQAGNDTVAQRSWLFPNPTPVNNDLIDPATGFTIQLYAGVFGLSAFPTTFDHDFIDHTQIFIVGNGEASAPDSKILADATTDPAQVLGNGGNKEWFTYTDLANGKIYAAHSVAQQPSDVIDPVVGDPMKDGVAKTVNLRVDTGVRMLERLKKLGDLLAAAKALPMNDVTRPARIATAQNNYDLFKQNVEVMRSLHNAFGYGQYKTDAPFYL